NNLIYIFTILESIEKINLYTKDLTDDEEFYYANNQMNFNAVVSLLIAIGEENKKIDQQIKDDHTFSWNDISKMRDKISHNYRGINPYMVWDIIKNSLGDYQNILREILPKIDQYEEALDDALNSNFYTHLEYLKDKK
ncbi:MAG: DUF86 domain-containing protein, partial [Sulfurimonas sp.]|nr:DUF86 domain-containing protein [Sulfurimonas sp.]